MPARSLDSYRETLICVLQEVLPSRILEWGPGLSTDIMAAFPTVMHIDSIEDSDAWYNAYLKRKPFHVNLIYQPVNEKYSRVESRDKYDLVFIDGKDRSTCLMEAKKVLALRGVVILHDAERPQYEQAIRSYKFYRFTDNGNTCVLAEDDDIGEKLNILLSEKNV